MAMTYLELQLELHPERAEDYQEMLTFFRKKQYHQLTMKLVSFCALPCFEQGQELIELYAKFISTFEDKLNQLTVAQLVVDRIAPQHGADRERKAEMFLSLLEKVKNEPEPNVFLQANIALIRIAQDKMDETRKILEECKKKLEGATGHEQVVVAAFFQALSTYHKHKHNTKEFYKYAMQFLAYVKTEGMKVEEQRKWAFDIAEAALCAEGIFTFGELLVHPVAESLKGHEKAWIIDLLTAFNLGNIAAYEQILSTKAPAIAATQLHSDDGSMRTFLDEKIRVMALIEKFFRTEKTEIAAQGGMPFEEIAKATHLPVDQVEHLLMQALSQELVKGTINQITQRIEVTWVMPRVLEKEQLAVMHTRLGVWVNSSNHMSTFVRKGLQERKESEE